MGMIAWGGRATERVGMGSRGGGLAGCTVSRTGGDCEEGALGVGGTGGFGAWASARMSGGRREATDDELL